MSKERSTTLPTGLLLAGVLFWGISFVYVKQGVSLVDAYSFLFVRFTLASALLAVVFARRLRGYSLAILGRGVIIGAVLGVAFIAQTIGIQYTTAGNAAFITGLCVVLVPVITTVLDRRLPPPAQIAAVGLGLVGLALLALKLPFHIVRGDLWCLACAVLFAVQIVLISRLARGVDPLLFALTQLVVAALAAGASGLLVNGRITVSRDPVVWRALAYLAVFATAYMYSIQAKYQKYVSEIKATMIYSLEPVFAGIAAYLLLRETMPARSIAGGILIVVAMLLADLKKKSKE
jgi:drug/metabolite transporter (DMT)-like permease